MTSIPLEVDPIECNPEAMSREQKAFYRYWLRVLSKGRQIETESPLAYIDIYTESLVEKFIKNRNVLFFFDQLKRISDVYGGVDGLELRLAGLKRDAYVSFGDYHNAWSFMRRTGFFTVRDVFNICKKFEKPWLTADELFKIVRNLKGRLTKFGLQIYPEILLAVSERIEDTRHLQDFTEQFQHMDFRNLTDKDISSLSESYTNSVLFEYLHLQYKHDTEKFLSDDEGRKLQALNGKFKKELRSADGPYSFFRFNRPLFSVLDLSIPEPYVPSIVTVAVENQICELFRETENRIRQLRSLPQIGDGSISEAELFRKLRKQFPDQKIIKHAKPSWLTPQHLDIYFPARNIAIEYQGVQHLKPVDYFGGIAAFEAQKVRDERKKLLCYQNNCSLIYVYENYDFTELTREISVLVSTSCH